MLIHLSLRSCTPHTLLSLRSILFSVKNSGACGFDVIGHVLLHINTCLASCEFPASWKHTVIHPIHKSGSLSETWDEEKNHLFSSSHHGFRSHHSTETALLTVSDHILSATDCQDITLLCLLDLSKCFDVIDHPKLLSKLHAYSIDPTWFSSYLTGHTQSVYTTDGWGNHHLSRPLPNPIGVFQGSSLGPLLFQIFSNDLPLFAPPAHVVQYADDTQVLVTGKKNSLPRSLLPWNRHYHLWTPGSTPTQCPRIIIWLGCLSVKFEH